MDEGKRKDIDTNAKNVNLKLFRVDLYVAADVLGQILKPSTMSISA